MTTRPVGTVIFTFSFVEIHELNDFDVEMRFFAFGMNIEGMAKMSKGLAAQNEHLASALAGSIGSQ
jgi:hypothetical protein